MGVFKEDLLNIANNIDPLFYDSTIFITGATGYIGSVIVKSLIELNSQGKNIKIVVFVRNEEKAKKMFNDKVIYVVGDITDEIKYDENVDYILHLASETKSKEIINNPTKTLNSIILGTENVLNFAKKSKAKKVLYASSMEVYGRVNSIFRQGENSLGFVDLQNERSVYPLGKMASELLITTYFKEHKVNGVIARLSQTFGAGVLESENRVFMQFAKSVIDSDDIILHTKGDSLGNYTYITDAIIALFHILKNGEPTNAYNVVNEHNTMSIKKMAKLCTSLNKSIKIIYDIPKTNTFGYAPKTKLKLSGKKLKELGFEPQISLKESYVRLITDITERF